MGSSLRYSLPHCFRRLLPNEYGAIFPILTDEIGSGFVLSTVRRQTQSGLRIESGPQ